MASELPVHSKDRLTVGLSMTPRGEVGLMFATIRQSLDVISPQIFSVLVLTVLLTTVISPFLLNRYLLKIQS